MIRLRHIKGPRIEDLERELETNDEALNIMAINKVGDIWYLHFTIDMGGKGKKKPIKMEIDNGSKTLEQRPVR